MIIDTDKWQEIFESIRRHKIRTILTAFGVAWGIFMLVMLLGMSQGLKNGIRHQFEGDAVNSIWISPQTTTKPYRGLKENRRLALDIEDYDFVRKEFPEVANLSAKYFLGSRIVKRGLLSYSYEVQGIHPDAKFIENPIILNGRFVNQSDLEQSRKVAVIGQIVYDNLFKKNENAVGEEIFIDNVSYKIIGVFEDKEGEYAMRRIYVPVSTLQEIYSTYNHINQLILEAGDLSTGQMALLEQGLRKSFAARKKFDINDVAAMRFFNLSEQFAEFESLMFSINSLMWIVGVFSIIAGVIGVSNIMLIIVKDRTREIGIRKAIGATPRSIVMMIFQESIFITAISGYVGLVLGVAVMALMSNIETEFFRNPQINLGIALGASFVLIAAGALAGLLPSIQAAKINPVKAIKND